MECAYCGKKIGVLRKLQHAEFCSAAHQKAYLKKQEALALDFLMQNKQRPKPVVPQVPPVETAPAAPPPPAPRPLPPAAEFVAEHAAPAGMDASLDRSAQPRSVPTAALLPVVTGLSSPAARLSTFVGLTVAANSSPAHAIGRSEFPFAGERPRLPGSSMGPLWIEPAREAPKERPHAGFAPMGPKWAPQEPGEVRAATVIRCTIAPALRDAPLAPRSPAVTPALAVRCSIEMNRRLALPLGSAGTAWHQAWKPTFEPRAPVALRKSGISCSAEMALPVSRSKPAPPAAVRSAAGRSMVVARTELSPAVNLAEGRRSLARAESATIAPPRATPAAKSTTIATAPIVWRSQVRFGPYTRVGAIRPNFDAPALEQPSGEDPIRRLEPIVRVRWTARLAAVSHTMPGWSRRLAVLVLLAAVVWVGAGLLRHSKAAHASQDEMWARIRQRAAVEIHDDFRSGLSQWAGGPDWAKSWSYDGTGFARPGRLALLSSSLPLDDYRLDFTAQIERKAVAWVFRAADRNNYYATKLVESKRGAAMVFSIVRYAVVDGSERFKTELPLPVTPSARTLLHVRQEIRGAQFTTYLDGGIIDTWSDSSLTRGGVGFFADPGESAYIRSIEVAQNDDNMGRLCSHLASLRGK
jgi:hypothetical protein